MNITVEQQPKCAAILRAEIPAEIVQSNKQEIIKAYAKSAKVQGFRPGKVPVAVIEKRFAKDINEELLQRLFSLACDKALEDESLRVLDFGIPSNQQINEAGVYSCESNLMVLPEISLPEYKKLALSVPSTDATDKEVDDVLVEMQERFADFEVVERAIELGDIAVIDFSASMAEQVDGKTQTPSEFVGKPLGFLDGREDQWIRIEDDSFLPNFPQQMVGAVAGEKRDVTVTLPENFPVSDLVGKDVVFHVTVREVRKKVVAEINDELAGKITGSEDATVESLREEIKKNLTARKEQSNHDSKIEQIMDILSKEANFEVPEAVIASETQGLMQRKLSAAMQNNSLGGDVNATIEAMKSESSQEAERNVRVHFILNEIARKEDIQVSDQELYNAVAWQAEQNKQPLKAYVTQLRKRNGIQPIKMQILTGKVLDYVMNEAEVTVSEAAE